MQENEAGPSNMPNSYTGDSTASAESAHNAPAAPLYAVPATQFYSVEYPGYVKPTSVSQAVDRLGGPSKLESAFKRTGETSSVLEFQFRPGNSFAHPVPGEVASTNSILLKVVKRRRKKKNTETGDPEVPAGEYVIQPVGVIHKTARFRGMADYQFQPDLHDPIMKLRDSMNAMDIEGIISYRVPPDEKEDYNITETRPMNIDIDPALVGDEEVISQTIVKSNLRLPPPPVFSRVVVPQNYNYKANPSSIVTTVVDETTGEEKKRLINRGRWKGFGPIAINFGEDATPNKPAATIQAMRPQANKDVLKRLEVLFEERPIWTRAALFNQLTAFEVRECTNAKYLLPLVSYVFVDGPWRDTQVKLGYDPRQDPEARFYQRVYFRDLNHPIARPSVVGRRQDTSNEASSRHEFTADDKTSHIFDGLRVTSQTAAFQLCDLTDPMLKSMVEDDEEIRETCHERDGWYTTHAFENIKTVLRHKYFSLKNGGIIVSDEDCENLLKREGEAAPVRSFHKLRPTKHNMAKGALRPEDAAAKRLRAKVDQQARMSNRS